jgi:hypothetical protein
MLCANMIRMNCYPETRLTELERVLASLLASYEEAEIGSLMATCSYEVVSILIPNVFEHSSSSLLSRRKN